MPNWCSNHVMFWHEDPAMIKRLYDAAQRDELFSEFVPVPTKLKETVADHKDNPDNLEEHGYSSWYDFCVNEWGTKWEASNINLDLDETANAINGFFETAWGPPIAFYRKLNELGFQIDAEYYEEGMQFCGTYDNANDDQYFNYDFDNENWRDGLPEHLAEYLEDSYEMHLEYLKEQDEA